MRHLYALLPLVVMNPPALARDMRWGSIPGSGRSPGGGHGNPLQYSCLENPWTEEPGGFQSMESHRVRQDWATNTSTFRHLTLRNLALFCGWEDARVQASWNHLFLMHLSYLGLASCNLIIHIFSSLLCRVAARWLLDSRHSSSWAQKFIFEGLQLLMAVTFLFTDMSGNTLIFWAPKSLQMVIAAMKLKDAYSLEGKLW